MSRSKVLIVAAVCLATLVVTAIAQKVAKPDASVQVVKVQMTARKYKSVPNTSTARKGQVVRLIITVVDCCHGFKLKEFGIDQKLKKRIPTTIEFTACETGTFQFKCLVFCGFGHGRLKGKLVVEDTATP